ncbi:MAG: hypothetical protein OHK0039_09690 [Bacteroidia bacterium]
MSQFDALFTRSEMNIEQRQVGFELGECPAGTVDIAHPTDDRVAQLAQASQQIGAHDRVVFDDEYMEFTR